MKVAEQRAKILDEAKVRVAKMNLNEAQELELFDILFIAINDAYDLGYDVAEEENAERIC